MSPPKLAIAICTLFLLGSGTSISEAAPGKQKRTVATLKQTTSRALLLVTLRQYRAAIKRLDQAIAADPAPFYRSERAFAYLSVKEPEKAMPDLDLTLKTEPDNFLARQRRAYAFLMMKKPAQAIADCEKILAMAPDDEVSKGYLRGALAMVGRRQGAEKRIRELCHYQGGDEWLHRIDLLDRKDAFEEARKTALDHIKRFPLDPRGYEAASKLTSEPRESLRLLDKCIELYPGHMTALWSRARVFESMKNYQRAVADLSAVIQDSPRTWIMRYDRARNEHLGKRLDEAILEYEFLSAADPESDEAPRKAGECYMEKGDYNRAVSWYSKALERMPDQPEVLYRLRAKAYQKAGKAELARKDLEKAKAASRPLFR
ncbi:MAG: tetratricopeptide repeat protein [Candidatus Melainabacteria bacterium]|nr:tetratricopeptide repeat protein [Candidatus Melainabacteria bacterium]